ncbi:hypothetical protein ACQ4PT_052348 [Festuca glaucescens]
MGDYSSTWSDVDNGYTGNDDSSSENSSKSRIYENVPPDGQNVPSSAYSEDMSERVIAKLNKEGVIYRRDNKGTSEGDKESESSKKEVYSSKYFTSVHKDEDVDKDDVREDELDNANGTTPAPSVAHKLMNDDPQPSVLFNCSKGDQKDPIQITYDLPARSSSSLSSSAFASARPNEPQKRKRMPSAKVRSPYLSEKMQNANKRQIREGKTPEGNFHSVDALLQVNDLTEDHVEAAVSPVKELSNYIDIIEALRTEIAYDIAKADQGYPDPSDWPIKQYKMPRQKYGNSCGLWVLKCMEEWDGNEFRTSITQTLVDSTREVMVSEIIFSPSNELDSVKDKLLNPNGEEDDA